MALEKKFPRENIDEPHLPPVEEVLNMRQQGLNQDQISSNLESSEYSPSQISDAMTQAEIKRNISGNYPYQEPNANKQLESLAPAPSDMEPSMEIPEETFGPQPDFPPQPIPPSQPRYQEEHVEELVESVVNEKWEDLTGSFGDLNVWKEKTNNDILSIKQEILRFEQRLENLQKAVLGKVSEYDKNIRDVGSDIKALEMVLQKILGPLTSNVKELSKIAERAKQSKQVTRIRKPVKRHKKKGRK